MVEAQSESMERTTSPYAEIRKAHRAVKHDADLHPSREYSLALTKLEEAGMWLLKAQENFRKSGSPT